MLARPHTAEARSRGSTDPDFFYLGKGMLFDLNLTMYKLNFIGEFVLTKRSKLKLSAFYTRKFAIII